VSSTTTAMPVSWRRMKGAIRKRMLADNCVSTPTVVCQWPPRTKSAASGGLGLDADGAVGLVLVEPQAQWQRMVTTTSIGAIWLRAHLDLYAYAALPDIIRPVLVWHEGVESADWFPIAAVTAEACTSSA
jgi:hypothetical protein